MSHRSPSPKGREGRSCPRSSWWSSGQSCVFATQPYPRSPRWPLTGPPTPDSWRSLRRAGQWPPTPPPGARPSVDRRTDGCFIFHDAIGERRDEARLGPFQPDIKFGYGFGSHHALEGGDDISRLDEQRYPSFNGCHGDALVFREVVTLDSHEPCNGASRWRA